MASFENVDKAIAGSEKKTTMVRDFSRVIIMLENSVIPEDKLSPTPSTLDGLSSDTENDLRILGCEMIQTSGILLKLPQVAMATGQVLFQRFYYSKSFVKHPMEVLAMACINLASKIEEAPRRIRDVVNVFHHIRQIRNKKTISPLVLDQNYVNTKNQVIKAERRVLKELGFCVHVQHPHKIIVMYLRLLDSEHNQRLVQCAWNYMNDSFRSNAFVRYSPEWIACACIYLAARQLQIPLPNSPPWYALFGIQEDDIKEICLTILWLYSRPKPNADELDRIVSEKKKESIEAKLKAKELASNSTPKIVSQSATPDNTQNASPLMDKLATKKSDEDKSDVGSGRNNRLTRPLKRSRSRSNSRHKKTRSDDRSLSSFGRNSRSGKDIRRLGDFRSESRNQKSRVGDNPSKSYSGSSRSTSRSPRSKRPRSKHYDLHAKNDHHHSRTKSSKYDKYDLTTSKYDVSTAKYDLLAKSRPVSNESKSSAKYRDDLRYVSTAKSDDRSYKYSAQVVKDKPKTEFFDREKIAKTESYEREKFPKTESFDRGKNSKIVVIDKDSSKSHSESRSPELVAIKKKNKKKSKAVHEERVVVEHRKHNGHSRRGHGVADRHRGSDGSRR